MEYHKLEKEVVMKELETNISSGLSQKEVNIRIEKYGLNELEKPKQRSLILKFFDQLKDFMIIILLAAAVLSFITGDVTEGILVIAIVLINALLGIFQEAKAEKALHAIQKMASPHAQVRRDGIEMIVDVSDLVIGDIVLIEAGDYIPADVRLVECVNLKVDESA